jgi:hypothetical protein
MLLFGISAARKSINPRSHLPGYAASEIHPVMKLTVQWFAFTMPPAT